MKCSQFRISRVPYLHSCYFIFYISCFIVHILYFICYISYLLCHIWYLIFDIYYLIFQILNFKFNILFNLSYFIFCISRVPYRHSCSSISPLPYLSLIRPRKRLQYTIRRIVSVRPLRLYWRLVNRASHFSPMQIYPICLQICLIGTIICYFRTMISPPNMFHRTNYLLF